MERLVMVATANNKNEKNNKQQGRRARSRLRPRYFAKPLLPRRTKVATCAVRSIVRYYHISIKAVMVILPKLWHHPAAVTFFLTSSFAIEPFLPPIAIAIGGSVVRILVLRYVNL